MVGSLITTIQSFLPSISPPPSVQLTVTAVNSETLILLNTGADPSYETTYREQTEV